MSLHISAAPGSIAPVVLMPGDPLRAKFIADNFLENAQLVSHTRNVFFYTGTYKGKRITVGASGMGCPSIGIYSYELYKEYDVQCIIRIGTCGSYHSHIGLYEIINTDFACSESTFAHCAFGFEGDQMVHQGNAFDHINKTASAMGLNIRSGNIHSSDVFYRAAPSIPAVAQKHDCLAVEMEAFALFANARYLNRSAATLLTVSDVIPTREEISPDARERSLKTMIELALESGTTL